MPERKGVPNLLTSGGLDFAPAPVNILGAYRDAASTAEGIWQNRAWQAKQAAGDAQRRAIDANGVYQPNVAGQNLAAAGPNAALAAPAALESSQRLSDAQLGQAQKKTSWVNAASGAALQSGDFSDSAMLHLFQTGMANGMLTLPEVQKQLAQLPPDPAGRQRWLREHQMTAASTQQQLDQTYGTTGTATGRGGVSIGTVQRPASQGGGLSAPPQPGVPMGPSPDTVFTAPPEMVPDQRPGAAPGTYTPIPRSYPGAPGGAAAPPIPGNGGYTPPKTAGYQPRGGAPAPTPDVSPAPAAGDGGTTPQQTYLSPPQGQPATFENDQKIHFAASQATNDQQKRAIAGETALQALALARTGPGTATEAQYAAFLEAHGFSVPDKAGMSTTDYRQLLKKNLIRFAQAAGKEAGTDFQLTEKLASNANVDEMTNPANEHVLVQDMGILRRDMAMTRTMPQPSGTGDVAKHVKAFPGDTDPRAFAIDLMSSSERAALLKEAAKQGPDGKIYKSLKLAHDHGHISLPSGP